jgi:hypothetical protein
MEDLSAGRECVLCRRVCREPGALESGVGGTAIDRCSLNLDEDGVDPVSAVSGSTQF